MANLIKRERLINNFLEMLKEESPSLKELPMAEWLKEYLSYRNIEVVMDRCADEIGGNCGNVVAHIKGDIQGESICFAAHMDQISPCCNVKPIIDKDLIRTDGSTTLGGDDKGGIAVILEALEHILEEHICHRDMYLLFTVSEEQGLAGSKHFDIRNLPVENVIFVDAAGPAGIIVYKSPAQEDIEIIFKGRKAHAGIEPEKGVNAICVAAEAIYNMHIGRIDEETTSNIGRIEGGGATNIVTDEVKFTAEIRSHSMKKLKCEIDFMMNCCKNVADKYNATVDFIHKINYPSLELSKDSYVYKLCIKAFEDEGVKPVHMISGGGGDANILSGKGYNCAIISVGMDNVHTVDETINIEDMLSTAKVISKMMIQNSKG